MKTLIALSLLVSSMAFAKGATKVEFNCHSSSKKMDGVDVSIVSSNHGLAVLTSGFGKQHLIPVSRLDGAFGNGAELYVDDSGETRVKFVRSEKSYNVTVTFSRGKAGETAYICEEAQ